MIDGTPARHSVAEADDAREPRPRGCIRRDRSAVPMPSGAAAAMPRPVTSSVPDDDRHHAAGAPAVERRAAIGRSSRRAAAPGRARRRGSTTRIAIATAIDRPQDAARRQHLRGPGCRAAAARQCDHRRRRPAGAGRAPGPAIAFRTMMTRNSTIAGREQRGAVIARRRSPSRARGWRSACAPDRAGECGSCTALPATITTAMVSPTARPIPRMTAATMPGPGRRQHDAPDRLPLRRAHARASLPGRSAAPPAARRARSR